MSTLPTLSIARNMKDIPAPPLMLGIQGASGTGKTWSALTFPNPIVLDIDRSLTAHSGKDITTVPFWDDEFCVKTMGMKYNANGSVNKRDGIYSFLVSKEVKSLVSSQTLVLDSWTALQNAFEMAFVQAFTKQGQPDEFAFWEDKIAYSRKTLVALQSLSCNVVVTFHEYPQRDNKTGMLLEKIQPLMQGKFASELKTYFTDFFRQVSVGKLNNLGKPNLVNGQPITSDVYYGWQVRTDDNFEAKRRGNCGVNIIPANYKELMKNYNAKV